MQQTEKYKLNLIESSDPFLPEGLNANTQKIEAAMIAHEAEVDEEIAAVGERVTVLEAHKVIVGSYIGDYVFPRKVDLGFTPKAIFLFWADYNAMLLNGIATVRDLEIVEGGIYITGSNFNHSGATISYLAFV